MASKGPFDEGPPLRRVYDKKDIIVQAMLNSGLEELITNGFYMEQVNEKKENPKPIKNEDLKPIVLKKDIKNPERISVDHTSKTFHSNQEAKYKTILAELYQMEEELKSSNMRQKPN